MSHHGHWVDPARSWNDTTVSYCQVCGRLIPRRSWVFADGPREIVACSPDCEDLYQDYVKPTYGEPSR
jgi:hypothetical protein